MKNQGIILQLSVHHFSSGIVSHNFSPNTSRLYIQPRQGLQSSQHFGEHRKLSEWQIKGYSTYCIQNKLHKLHFE